MNKNMIGVVIVVLVMLAAGFFVLTVDFEEADKVDSSNKDTVSSDDKTPPALGNITSFDEAVNYFAFNLYKEFYNDPANSGNIFNSPYSIFTALAMTYEGAKGTTAEEMANVLSIEQDNDSFHEYMKALYEYLNQNSNYDISTANALWPSIDYTLLPGYIKVIKDFYGGEVSNVDYSDPEAAAERINNWVEEQTNNLIQDLVPASAIDPVLTKLILTNAIYFKGTWQVQFDEDNTTDKEFTTSSGEKIDVQTMQLLNTHNYFNYTVTDDMQILELPYAGNEISMMIFLPRDGYELSDVINNLDKDTYSDLIDSMHQIELDIYLPKFEIKTPLYGLNQYLIDLGMPTAFANADFSGLDGLGILCISDVLHKAYIDVNEEGTEAAAATAVMMRLTSVPDDDEPERPEFKADHPFFFTIHQKQTNTILFMGNVNDPSTVE